MEDKENKREETVDQPDAEVVQEDAKKSLEEEDKKQAEVVQVQ